MNPMKSSSPGQRLEQAIQYGRNRKYAQAAALLEGLITEADPPPSALLYLGRSYHALGEYPRAISTLRSYIRTGDSGEEGYFFLGRSYLALNLYSRALWAFQKSLEINENSQAALTYLAYTLLKRGDISSALTCFEKAVEGDPEDQQLYAGYMNTLFLQGIREFQQGNLELARDRLSFIEDKGGDSLLLHLYLGILEREVGSLSKALDHYGKAIKLRPEDPSIRFQHAEVMLLSNRPDEAYRELTYLVEQSGTSIPVEDLPSLHRLLASILFEKAQYRRAIFFAVKVLKETADPDMHLLIGEGYRHLEA
ncbi:MAG: tetratricopeptide repeat protein, partial [Spirochaetales bacterium]|nr:tetratricopeptide repeat protein [Spirochaetales bacterium]